MPAYQHNYVYYPRYGKRYLNSAAGSNVGAAPLGPQQDQQGNNYIVNNTTNVAGSPDNAEAPSGQDNYSIDENGMLVSNQGRDMFPTPATSSELTIENEVQPEEEETGIDPNDPYPNDDGPFGNTPDVPSTVPPTVDTVPQPEVISNPQDIYSDSNSIYSDSNGTGISGREALYDTARFLRGTPNDKGGYNDNLLKFLLPGATLGLYSQDKLNNYIWNEQNEATKSIGFFDYLNKRQGDIVTGSVEEAIPGYREFTDSDGKTFYIPKTGSGSLVTGEKTAYTPDQLADKFEGEGTLKQVPVFDENNMHTGEYRLEYVEPKYDFVGSLKEKFTNDPEVLRAYGYEVEDIVPELAEPEIDMGGLILDPPAPTPETVVSQDEYGNRVVTNTNPETGGTTTYTQGTGVTVSTGNRDSDGNYSFEAVNANNDNNMYSQVSTTDDSDDDDEDSGGFGGWSWGG